jgi:Mg-chelatase subunit ChlD
MALRSRSLLLPGLLAALVAASAPLPSTLARPAPQPAGSCQVTVDKTARPTSVLLGDEVEIALSIQARCPSGSTGGGPADIVLAIDRSSSMSESGHWLPAIDAARGFVDLIDFSAHQVGLVTFGFGPHILAPDTAVDQPLSADKDAVARSLAAIPPPPVSNWSTNFTGAISTAQGELTSARHRPAARSVLVLLTDGAHNDIFARSPVQQAAEAKAAGTQIITIGLGTTPAAADQLRQIASAPELFFESPTDAQLAEVYTAIAGVISSGGSLTDLEITDLLTPDVAYVDGSAVPAPSSVQPGELRWRVATLPPNGWAARYRVKTLRSGTYATNKLAYVDYVDADGSIGSATFPQPLIKVRLPGENGIFLPILFRDHCPPQRPFDVALVVDTSSSMDGDKLAQTRVAAREFLDLLTMPPSRSAVVAFHSEAQVVTPLTTDRTRAALALDTLPRGEGTRIDLALHAARETLTGPDADPSHAKVYVLLTDGRQDEGREQDAVSAAAAARRAGLTGFIIGVGPDAEATFLTGLAGDPDRYFAVSDATGLLRIYQAIAGTIPCTVR